MCYIIIFKKSDTIRLIMEEALFGKRSLDFVSYDEMVSYVDQKIKEALQK